MTICLVCRPSSPAPQNEFGITVDRAARQKAETSEAGVAKSVKFPSGGEGFDPVPAGTKAP
jgi:hypothetical protein